MSPCSLMISLLCCVAIGMILGYLACYLQLTSKMSQAKMKLSAMMGAHRLAIDHISRGEYWKAKEATNRMNNLAEEAEIELI